MDKIYFIIGIFGLGLFIFWIGAIFGRWISETHHLIHDNFKSNCKPKTDFLQQLFMRH